MKKLVSLLLAVGMCLSVGATLTACDNTTPLGSSSTESESSSVAHVHEFATEWSKDETHHWRACAGEDCADVEDKAEHTWNDGEITTPATKDNDGVKTFTCTVCSQKKTESVKLTNTITKEEWLACLNSNNVTMSMYVNDKLNQVCCWDSNSFVAKTADGQVAMQHVNIDGLWYYLRTSNGVTIARKTSGPIDTLASLVFRGGDLEKLYDKLTYDETTKEYTLITTEFDDDIEYYRFYCENGKILTMELKNNEMSSGANVAKNVFSDWGSTTVDIPEYTIEE